LKLVISGGAGTLGRVLARNFSTIGFDVVVLSRRNITVEGARVLHWDGKSVDAGWAHELQDSVLINLSGELVDRIPTKKNIDLLESSRVEPTLALISAAKEFGSPKVWLQMSTLAIYGDAGQEELDETALPADGPRQMAGVSKAWETAVTGGTVDRLVFLRTGVVLEPGTPALNRLVTMTKLFLGGTVASGKQWVSWIDYRDFVRAIEFIIANDSISGIVHVTSPNPVQNKVLMATLREKLGRPWSPPTPAFLVKLGGILLFRTDPQLALTGRRAVPKKLQSHGFKFEYDSLEQSLGEL
jgi:uncharacterized protein (TIGR01777 family)